MSQRDLAPFTKWFSLASATALESTDGCTRVQVLAVLTPSGCHEGVGGAQGAGVLMRLLSLPRALASGSALQTTAATRTLGPQAASLAGCVPSSMGIRGYCSIGLGILCNF